MIKIDKEKPVIAITGGTGFVGQHLIKQLVNYGYKVNLLVHQRKVNYPSIKTIPGDLVSAKGLDEFLEEAKVLIHLAGRFAPPNSEIFKNNVTATFNLLEKCVKHKIEKIIFSSGIALYGEPEAKSWKETDKPKPNTVYGLCKLLAEEIIRYWSENYNIEYFFLRFPNIYGPGNRKGVIFNFLRTIFHEGKVLIYGNGYQRRDFLFVNDAVESIIQVLNYHGPSNVFNIASGETVSLLELVNLLGKLLKRRIPIEFKKPESHVVMDLSGDIEKAKDILGWQPKISLEEGLKLMLKKRLK